MNTHKFPYNWNLKDGYPAKGIDYHGSKVFSCFACGGGSTMGYKLAGYDVLGCNEIDPKMNAAYVVLKMANVITDALIMILLMLI